MKKEKLVKNPMAASLASRMFKKQVILDKKKKAKYDPKYKETEIED